jgi:hypothetical protein
MAVDYTCRMPAPGAPIVDPQTGIASESLFHWMLGVFKRTGNAPGLAAVDVQTLANAAQAAAAAASGAVTTEAGVRAAADTANASAITTEAGTRAAADLLLAPKASPALTGTPTAPTAAPLTNTTQLATTAFTTLAVGVETTARVGAVSAEAATRAAADLLLAPQANPIFTGTIFLPILTNAANDAAAATAGLAIGQLYRNGSIVMQRIV